MRCVAFVYCAVASGCVVVRASEQVKLKSRDERFKVVELVIHKARVRVDIKAGVV